MYKTLWFSHKAHQDLMQIASQAADGLETGGHLFGYTYRSLGDIVVTMALPAGPKVKRRWNGLDWDPETCKEYRQKHTKGYRVEIGDFHTHPVAEAEPSGADEAGQRRYRAEWDWSDHYPDILLIVGVPPGGTPQQVGAWFYTPTERVTLQIKVADADWQPPIDEDGNWIERQQGVS